MKSIRTYLVLAVAATLILVLFIALLKGYSASTKKAEILFDRELQDVAVLIAAANQDITPQGKGVESQVDKTVFFQIWTDDKQLISASNNAPNQLETDLLEGYSNANFSHYRWRILTYRDRVLSRWIIVGERQDIRLTFAETMVLESMLPMIIAVLLSSLLVWFLVGKGLQPLHQLTTALRQKQPADLSEINMVNTPQELIPVVSSINSLFERLSGAFDRERQFSANAAHELRTPIAALKLHAENLQASSPEDDKDIGLLVAGAERMHYVTEQILALHRTIPDQAASAFQRLDLSRLVREEISSIYDLFELKNQDISLSGGKSSIQGNEFGLRTLIQNLLSNASKYTPDGGKITVLLETEPDGVILRVIDSGVGIPEEKRHDVFKRFYRLDDDRHDSGTLGCGLGLAIVQHIVTLHDATITLSDSDGASGLMVSVYFPNQQQMMKGEKNAR